MILFDGIKSDERVEDAEGLEGYLNEVWQQRPLFLLENDDEDERRSTKQRFCVFNGAYIKPRNYVGFIQYNDQRINIYPRVFCNHPSINVEADSSRAVEHLLKWLSYSSRLHFPFSEVQMQLLPQDDWLEAFIFLFANFTLQTLSNAPVFAYEEVTEEMPFVRGRIAMQPYINHNLSKGRHQFLHCTYEPFAYDNQFNRVVKYTCRLLMNATEKNASRYLLNDILFLLDEVEDVYCSASDCDKVKVNRLYPEIGTITNMCAAFLNNQTYSDGLNSKQNLCILLPMEIIYEQYIAGFIQTHFPELKAVPQASNEYVAQTGEEFKQNVFRMKHDILLPGKIVIDTKYKFRYISDDFKGGVNQSDLYQMVTYCYKRKTPKGLLLYPRHFDKKAQNEKHKFKVEDMMIDACSIDITENNLSLFDEEQIKKFNIFLYPKKLNQ